MRFVSTRLYLETPPLFVYNAKLSGVWCSRFSMQNFCVAICNLPWYHKDLMCIHDDIIKWKHFPRYWPFVRGIHRSRWIHHTKASDAELWFFSLISSWKNCWLNNGKAGDLKRHHAHYDGIVMSELCGVFGDVDQHHPSTCQWALWTLLWSYITYAHWSNNTSQIYRIPTLYQDHHGLITLIQNPR